MKKEHLMDLWVLMRLEKLQYNAVIVLLHHFVNAKQLWIFFNLSYHIKEANHTLRPKTPHHIIWIKVQPLPNRHHDTNTGSH